MASCSFLRDAIAERHRFWVMGISVWLAGIIGKTVFEIVRGTTLFVDSAAANMVAIPLAHVTGIGVCLAFGRIRDQRAASQYLNNERGGTIASSRSLTLG